MGRTRELTVYGPKGIVEFVKSVNRVVKFYGNFPLKVSEVKPGCVIDESEYQIMTGKAEHGIECFAYALVEKLRPGRFSPSKARRLGIPEGPLWRKIQTSNYIRIGNRKIPSRKVLGPPRPGVKITYAVDTRPCSSIVKLARRSDLLIHDSTFDTSASQKAREYGHSTSSEAAHIAVKCKARKLALFHISAMYADASPLLVQAKRVHRNTILSNDMTTIYVSRNR